MSKYYGRYPRSQIKIKKIHKEGGKMATSKSLLGKTSKPKKTTSKKANKSTMYLFDIDDILVYLGSTIENRNGQEVKVISRSKTHIQAFYKIEFEDGKIVECISDVLKYVEDYELELAQLENQNQENVNDISEEEKRIISLNLEPYHNKHACLNPIALYEMRCNDCCYESKCIYRNKYNYKKNKYD